jgi:hypothetical protein
VPEAEQCAVCLTYRATIILAPCGHKQTCRRCTKRLMEMPPPQRTCPCCKVAIESFVTTVFAG